MPDWAVTARIGAANGLSGPFATMARSVLGFGNSAGAAFDHASKRASLFKTLVGSQILSNLVTGAIRAVTREIRELPQMIGDFASRADEIERMSSRIGVTAEAFQRLSYAATMTDTPVDTFSKGVEFLNKNIGTLRTRSGALYAFLGKTDPALARQLLTVKDSGEAFLIMADAVNQAADEQTRAALVQAAFGKSGQDLVTMLAGGRAALQKFMTEASIYGNILPDAIVKAGAAFDETMKRMRGSTAFLRDTLLGSLMKAVSPYVGKLTEWIAANRELLAQKITGFVDNIVVAVTRFGRWITDHKAEIVEFWNTLKDAAGAVWRFGTGLVGAMVAFAAEHKPEILALWNGLQGVLGWIVDHADTLLKIAAAWTAIKFISGPIGLVTKLIGSLAGGGAAAAAAKVVAPTVVGGLGPAALKLMGGGAAAVAGATSMAALSLIPPIAAALTVGRSALPMVTQGQKFQQAARSGEKFEGGGIFTNLFARAAGLGYRLAGVSREPAPVQPPNAVAAAAQRQTQESMRLFTENKLRFTVDNTAAPGVRTRIRQAPASTLWPGAQYAGAR